MNKPLKWVAAQLGLTLEPAVGSDARVSGWSVDSRSLRPGDLYFALRGPNHDGHAYVAEVLAKGAVGAVADTDIEGGSASPILKVKNSLAALQSLASAARREWGGQVVGVTGSAGKTTTKDVIAEMLSEGVSGGTSGGTTAKTEGNLNNHVGLPLSLLRIDDQARIAVLEMGMNHAGEIRALAEIARPDVGVVTNVGWAHMESFDSIEGIAAAKRELIESLPPDGTAVLNSDDLRVAEFAKAHPGKVDLR
jgi:UDP-N-acetylmuramoyl-tripeptide--D-alanyl-D-alanine ligase